MQQQSKPSRPTDAAALVLGYCNFSSGAFDPTVWRAMSDLFAAIEPASGAGSAGNTGGTNDEQSVTECPTSSEQVAAVLGTRLDILAASEPAFRDSTQARAILEIVFSRLLPAYREYHADLLEHQPPGAIERPFFVMAAAQAALAAGGPWDEPERYAALVQSSILQLNDYVGWRPMAVLENGRLSEPYGHERVRPIPLFIAGVGAAHGRYKNLVAGAIEILASAPPRLLQQADFDASALEELAIDPRAFDFLHPAASRPNYLFGLWDPSHIDEQGLYRRMVVQQATLDGILSWAEAAEPVSAEHADRRQAELRRESSAVLAGVILMASGLCGHGPGAHQASLPLSELLPRIAGYRDEFYSWLMTQLPAEHGQRLAEETQKLRQPFGGVRRHINSLLASRRARQVESVALASVLARLGRAEGAERMAGIVPAASARMLSRIASCVVAAQQGLSHPDPLTATAATAEPLDQLEAATDLLFRAVGCGAAVDPWNILGLAGQFPLHEPGGESLADPRVDDLIAITGSILDSYASVWQHSSLDGPPTVARRAAAALERLAVWWDRHATTTVSGVQHLSGREVLESAREVIGSLQRRRETAPLPPPPGFWRKEVAAYSSPRSHSQAADALLSEGDLDGAMGLLVHWASLLEGTAIERSGPIWLGAAARWTAKAFADRSEKGRSRVRRFLELVEANTSAIADCIELAAAGREPFAEQRAGFPGSDEDQEPGDDADDDPAEAEESVASAYDSMVWRDSTDDGVDGGMLDMDVPGASSAVGVAAVEQAAEFFSSICQLLRHAVTAWCAMDVADGTHPSRAETDSVIGWRHFLRRMRRAMVQAAASIAARDTKPSPGMSPAEYDRLRWHRESAAERLIDAAVQSTETLWLLSAHLHMSQPTAAAEEQALAADASSPALPAKKSKGAVGRLFAGLLRGDATAARQALGIVSGRLAGKAVLYVPLSRGGKPSRIVMARCRERLLERLVCCLPRLGMVAETSTVVQLAKSLESKRPKGAASVSEFDRVFEAATIALVERIVESASTPGEDGQAASQTLMTQRILEGLSLLVPRLLETWMTHARQLRLSVLERVRDDKTFASIQEFIERYGSGLFTQHTLAPPSLRGILRGGARHFLEQLVERQMVDPADSSTTAATRVPVRLIEELVSGVLPIKQASARLRLVLESIAENHAEYRDWNSTTTQSDRGEYLHILLNFLRIKAEYDRIAWTLRPVNMAHRVLARRGVTEAAEAWRGRMRDETRGTADALVSRLSQLEAQWGMRLASISDRVRRSFTATLEQDELEALVEPAVGELFTGSPAGAGDSLERRADSFLGVASGSGVEVPDWLERLSGTVDRAIEHADIGLTEFSTTGQLPEAVRWTPIPWDVIHAALKA